MVYPEKISPLPRMASPPLGRGQRHNEPGKTEQSGTRTGPPFAAPRRSRSTRTSAGTLPLGWFLCGCTAYQEPDCSAARESSARSVPASGWPRHETTHGRLRFDTGRSAGGLPSGGAGMIRLDPRAARGVVHRKTPGLGVDVLLHDLPPSGVDELILKPPEFVASTYTVQISLRFDKMR